MIYPTLIINSDQSTIVNIYDTDYDDEPVLSMSDISGESIESFYTLLTLFMNQYQNGWEDGYWAGFEESMETEEEGDEEYWS